MSSPRPRSRALTALGILLLLNLAIIGVAWVFRQTVVPGWKKGPLIDPAAPYSPENAQLLFSVGLCVALDLYVLLLAAWRRFRPARWWVPWVALLVAALGAEGVLRAWLAVDMVTYFRPDPVLHWVVRSNLRDFDNLTGGGRITTNADGLRMPGPDDIRERGGVDPDVYRVLVLGDSSNFGHGVEGAEMWSAVLEGLLDPLTPRTVQVINGATPGWTTFQAVEFLRETGLAYDPDLVIAGFNNDPGPDYLHDADRVLPPGPRRSLSAAAWNSELYLLSREVLLSLIRRVSPAARATYTERRAGEDPKYGKLSEEEAAALVPRVPLDDFLANLAALDQGGEDLGGRDLGGQDHGYDFAWIDMPVNRNEPELVERYVDWGYRDAARRLAAERGFPVIEVDRRQARQRARDLHLPGHVFHPNARGHARLAQQVAAELLAAGLVPDARGEVRIEGPPPAATEETVRFGWSSRTPVHAHAGLVLEAMPQLAAAHGIVLDATAYEDGKGQGDDVGKGLLDAFFTTELPALHMLGARPDARIVGTLGSLGRIAVVGGPGVDSLDDLRGRRIGLAEGSTPAMDWATWSRSVGGPVEVVDLGTDALEPALASGEVAAIVGWDPWVEQWLRADPARSLLAERSFESVLAVGVPWAAPLPAVEGQPRAARLLALIEAALQVAASDRPRWDAAVAERSGWPVEVVRAVADRNPILAGQADHLPPGPTLAADLDRAAAWLRRPDLASERLLGLALLEGQGLPLRRGPDPAGAGPGVPPQGPPPGGPPVGGTPGGGPPGGGTPKGPPLPEGGAAPPPGGAAHPRSGNP